MIVEQGKNLPAFFSDASSEELASSRKTTFNGLSFQWIDDDVGTVLTGPLSEQLIFWGSPDLVFGFNPTREIDPNHHLSVEQGELYQMQINEVIYSEEDDINEAWDFLVVLGTEDSKALEFAIYEEGRPEQLSSYWFDITGPSDTPLADSDNFESALDLQNSFFSPFDDFEWQMSGRIDVRQASFGQVADDLDTEGTSTITVIANVFGSIMFLDGLTETVTDSSHTIEYQGTSFDYTEVDGFITTVVRDNEFTAEFAAEIAESFPDNAGISYSTAVALIGQANMESTLLMVAGADGNYVG